MAWETLSPPPCTHAHAHAQDLAPDGLAGAWLAQPGVRQAPLCRSPRQVLTPAPASLHLSPAWLMPGSSQGCMVPSPRPILSKADQETCQSCSDPAGSLARSSGGAGLWLLRKAKEACSSRKKKKKKKPAHKPSSYQDPGRGQQERGTKWRDGCLLSPTPRL